MKNKSQNLNGNLLPPPSGWNSGSIILPPTNSLETGPESGHFSNDDISRMPDNPPKYTGHRRAHSEIVTLPDDISFDSDLGVVGCFNGPEETEEDLFSMCQVSRTTIKPPPPAPPPPENHGHHGSGDRPKVKHQHSLSMDCSTTFNPEDTSLADAKKSMSAAKLAELALVDPKRAKRIWANRQSAARSKERKMRYIAELEREVQILQTEATSLSAQLTLCQVCLFQTAVNESLRNFMFLFWLYSLQRDVHGLTAENNELKLRLQTVEQQGHLQDALTDALKKEIHHLKLLTGQNLTNGGPMVNFRPLFGPNQRFTPNNQSMHTMLTAQQFQNQHPCLLQSPQLHQFQQQQLHQFQQQQQQQQRNMG
ncbi:hypothetical protein SSX86_023211 [Deinandra increscens subsp. villosa]|uniref:BZIP domain-containing protein n=1 Tax=Deinandra increscens subsp. villosa TaxID=3103831 RepID=A0AAP0CQ93_9ASTR